MRRYEDRVRDLKDNRILFLHLLEENSAAKFHEMLAERPMHMYMCYSADTDRVSLLLNVIYEIAFDYCWNCRGGLTNILYFIWLHSSVYLSILKPC